MTSHSVCQRILLPVILALAFTGSAFSQNAEQDLRNENQQLKQQVRDLQKELDEANAKIARLERLVERLQAELDNRSASQEPLDEPEVTIDESVPNASPRALYSALVDSHDEAMSNIDMGRDNDRQRIAYMRALERWVAAAERQFKSQIEWHVKLRDFEVLRTGDAKAMLIAVDPVTGTELGEPFESMLGSLVVRRIVPVRERGDLTTLVLNGVLVPHVRINTNRMDRGPFDSPKFIGPFVEYAMEVQVRSLVPVEKPKENPAPPAKRDSDGSTPSK